MSAVPIPVAATVTDTLAAWFGTLTDWLGAHPWLFWSLVGLSVATFVASLVILPILVVRMRADHFMPDRGPGDSWVGRHPVQAQLAVVLKNVLGVILVIAGIAMLVLPGQGVLTILIGISLMNFPGKRRLELAIVRIPAVHRGIDWMRARYGQPPLELPDDGDER